MAEGGKPWVSRLDSVVNQKNRHKKGTIIRESACPKPAPKKRAGGGDTPGSHALWGNEGRTLTGERHGYQENTGYTEIKGKPKKEEGFKPLTSLK